MRKGTNSSCSGRLPSKTSLRKTAILIVPLALLALLAAVPSSAIGQSASFPTLTVTTTFNFSPSYDFLGSGSGSAVVVASGTSLQVASNESIEFLTSFRPNLDSATATVNGKNVTLPVVVLSGRSGTFVSSTFQLPVNATSFFFTAEGGTGGSTFLWKYIANVPTVTVSGTNALVSYNYFVQMPSGNEIYHLYDGFGNPLSSNDVSQVSAGNGITTYRLLAGVSNLIVESTLFTPISIVVAAAALVVIVFVALGLFRKGKEIIGGFIAVGKSAFPKSVRLPFRIRALAKPRTLLALFLLCAILMVAIGAAGGPDPRVKAYVIADPSSVTQIKANLAAISGNVAVVTPSQDYIDFATMSSVGMFNLVVVSNYPSLALPPVEQYVQSSLGNVPVIVVDSSANQGFVQQIEASYGGSVVTVMNAANLIQGESSEIATALAQNARVNVLGIHLGVTQFKIILAIEGVLSFVLILVGWAYLGSLISDSGSQASWTFLAVVLAAGIFVFVFSEAIYIEVSSLLAFPLSLHAVISGAKDVTAVGLLGFGGGSTPRLAAGFVGVMAGFLLTEQRPPIHKEDFAIIIAIPLFLLADPFFVGNYIYEFILLFASPYAFGTAFVNSLSFKGFIYAVGSALGGGVTPTYLLTAGTMLFFAGLPLLAYLRRLGRTTLVLGLIACAFIIGDGGVRVGQMTPNQTFTSIVPGLFVGFAILSVFLGLATVERYVRGKV